MKTIDTKELERIISLYLDGELDQAAARSFEEYLAANPTVARDVHILRTAKHTLKGKKSISRNDWFWLKVSNNLENRGTGTEWFSTRKRPGLTLAAIAAVTCSVIVFMYIKDAAVINNFFAEKKQQMQTTLMTGSILPFFSNLDNDDILNFALFGRLSIDSAAGTAFQVKNSENDGTQIEIMHRQPNTSVSNVSVKEFYDQIGITTANQQMVVDSILGTYKQKLEASVLVSEHNQIAIHEQLADLNRVMVSSLASSLQPVQRVRFQKLLLAHQAPFALVNMNTPSRRVSENIPPVPSNRSGSNRYVVISRDTIGIEEMKLDLADRVSEVHGQEIAAQKAVTERMLQEMAQLQRQFEQTVVVSGSEDRRVRVLSTDKSFQISFHPRTNPSPDTELFDMVRPRVGQFPTGRRSVNDVRVIGDSAFVFEMTADDDAVRVFRRLPRGEFKFEILDSAVQSPKVKIMFKSLPARKEFEARVKDLQLRDEELIDLDSLLNESKNSRELPQKTVPDSEALILDL